MLFNMMKFWVARDEEGALYLYDDVPEKLTKCFIQQGYKEVMKLSDDLFPEITFENSPQEIELKLVK